MKKNLKFTSTYKSWLLSHPGRDDNITKRNFSIYRIYQIYHVQKLALYNSLSFIEVGSTGNEGVDKEHSYAALLMLL